MAIYRQVTAATYRIYHASALFAHEMAQFPDWKPDEYWRFVRRPQAEKLRHQVLLLLLDRSLELSTSALLTYILSSFNTTGRSGTTHNGTHSI